MKFEDNSRPLSPDMNFFIFLGLFNYFVKLPPSINYDFFHGKDTSNCGLCFEITSIGIKEKKKNQETYFVLRVQRKSIFFRSGPGLEFSYIGV